MSSRKNNSAPAISTQNLCVRFGDNVVVDHVSFAIPQGLVTAIIGPNGSGKTTLVRALMGLQPYSEGKIEILGSPLRTHAATIGYVPQYFAFDRSLPMTGEEFLKWTSGKNLNTATIWKQVGLADDMKGKIIGSFSGGQMQRLLIAQALLTNPDILILDEPDANIDMAGERQMEDILKEFTKKGGTVVLISHDVSFVARAVEHVICLNRSLICTGPPREALTESVLNKLFNNSAFYHHH